MWRFVEHRANAVFLSMVNFINFNVCEDVTMHVYSAGFRMLCVCRSNNCLYGAP